MIFCPDDTFSDALGGTGDGNGVVELCPADVYTVNDPYCGDPYFPVNFQNCTDPYNPYYCPVLFFTEVIINGNLIIPPQKPPKKHIIKDTHLIKLNDVDVIKVKNPDDSIAGYKILVSGIFTLGLQYVADVLDQKVHFVHYDLPFNALLMTDCGELIPQKPTDFVIHVCVEDIKLTQIDSRTINKQILLMVWAEKK